MTHYLTSVKINFYTYKVYSDRLYNSLRKKVEIHTVSRFSKNSLSSNIINETIQTKSDALLQRILYLFDYRGLLLKKFFK